MEWKKDVGKDATTRVPWELLVGAEKAARREERVPMNRHTMRREDIPW